MEKLIVLVFDRNERFAKVCGKEIEYLGYKARVCSSVSDIVHISAELEKDLKYADIALLNLCPELESGHWDVVDKLRTRNPLIKIFAMLSDETNPIMRKPDPIFNGALLKPFTLEMLGMMLNQAVLETAMVVDTTNREK